MSSPLPRAATFESESIYLASMDHQWNGTAIFSNEYALEKLRTMCLKTTFGSRWHLWMNDCSNESQWACLVSSLWCLSSISTSKAKVISLNLMISAFSQRVGRQYWETLQKIVASVSLKWWLLVWILSKVIPHRPTFQLAAHRRWWWWTQRLFRWIEIGQW